MAASNKVDQKNFHGSNGEQLTLSCDETGCLPKSKFLGL